MPRDTDRTPTNWGDDRGTSDSRSSPLAAVFAVIPAGWFTMGTDRGQEDERPPHRVFVDRFELAAFPITRAAYTRFVAAGDAEGLVASVATRR